MLNVPICVQSITILLFTRAVGYSCSTQKQMIEN